MSPTGGPPGAPPDWSAVDVAVPRHPAPRLPGVRMAGFQYRATADVPALLDIAMVAHPAVSVLVDLSDGEGFVYGAGGLHGRGSVVVGLLPGELRAGGRVGAILQIRLGPVAAAAVFGATSELAGSVAPLEALWGRDADRTEDRLRAAATWDDRFTIAADALTARIASRVTSRTASHRVDPEVAVAWRRTLDRRGLVRVDDLADDVGWSRKRLSARFRAQLGVTPKRAACLVRFDHAAHLLAAGRTPSETAAASGYTDQSHLHREVKEFTGLTPTAVAAAPWLAIDDVAWPQSRPAGLTGSRVVREAQPLPMRHLGTLPSGAFRS
ncbi:helix-turn-helix domain-containing protein [Streptomyces sp. NPDC052225]|uniref:helix-turn-helix domain-containing protein n=1 Tax=Streptomyces sp. NPDC052225 TaxID=3154949 RepID=UPI00344720A4